MGMAQLSINAWLTAERLESRTEFVAMTFWRQ